MGGSSLVAAGIAVLSVVGAFSPFFLRMDNVLISKDPAPDPLQAFEVGAWTVDPALQQLRRGADCRKLPPRQLQLLRTLAHGAGQTLPREQLIDRVWARRMVNDEVLSRAIADLRLALEDDARQPEYLVTVPKLGYRLIAPVRWGVSLPVAAGAALAEPIPSASIPESPSEPVWSAAVGSPDAARLDASVVRTEPVAEPTPTDIRPGPIAPATADVEPKAVRARRWPLFAVAATVSLLVAAVLVLQPAGTPPPDRVRQLLGAQPLTSAPGWERTPSFDHAGALIAWSESDDEGRGARIRLRSRDGRIDRRYADSEADDVCPRFSPDDRELLWTRHRGSDCELLRAPLLGGAPTVLAACAPGLVSCPDWQGDQIVYSAPAVDAEHAAGVSRLDLRSGRGETLSTPTAIEGPDLHPRFGPSGEIVFARGVEGDRSLWRWHGGRLTRAALPAGMLYGHAPLPEGGWLLASDAPGFRALIAIDLDRPGHTLLGARGARFPATAEDGSLAYEVATYDANLYRLAADGSAKRLTASQRYDAHPRVSPDGRWLVYPSNRDGPETIYLQDLDTGAERRLQLDPAYRWAQPAWALDGSGISLSRYRPDGVDLWWYAPATDRAEPYAAAPAGCHDAQPAADGRWVWCRQGRESDAELWRFPRQGAGDAERLRPRVAHYQLGPEDLVYLDASDGSFHHCTADASACQLLPIRVASGQLRNFALRDRALYYVPAGQERVRRRSLVDGTEADTAWPAPGTLTRALDVAADGSAVIARVDRLEIDLLWVSGK